MPRPRTPAEAAAAVPGATVQPAGDTIPSYIIQPGQTPKQVEMRRRMAQSLMEQGTSTAPVQGGWIEAATRPLIAGIAGMGEYGAAEEEKKGQRSAAEALSQALTGEKIQPQQLGNFFGNEWATPGQQSVLASVYENQQKDANQETFRPASPEEKAALGVPSEMAVQISNLTGKASQVGGGGTTVNVGADQKKGGVLLKSIGQDYQTVMQNFGALSDPGSQVGGVIAGVPGAGGIGRWLQSPDYQRAQYALANIIMNHAYATTGATMSIQEALMKAQGALPQLGDKAPAIKDKQARITSMIDALNQSATGTGVTIPLWTGDANAAPQPDTTQQPDVPQTKPPAPQPGEVQDGFQFKGGDPADPNSWVKVQ
jgi:hypothetical protein